MFNYRWVQNEVQPVYMVEPRSDLGTDLVILHQDRRFAMYGLTQSTSDLRRRKGVWCRPSMAVMIPPFGIG